MIRFSRAGTGSPGGGQPAPAEAAGPPKNLARTAGNAAFALLLAGFAAMILLPPVFPTQDGPMHVYHAEIFGSLLRGEADYAGIFRITQYLPPYSLFTYTLLALNLVLRPEVSEKLFLCGYLVWFCFSFRYLVHSLQPANMTVPLLAFPLVMHRLVYLGFYNFSFGLATALFFAGYWIRHHARLEGRRSLGIVALIAGLALTHPMGLMLSLGFGGLHCLTGMFDAVREDGSATWTPRIVAAVSKYRRQIAHLALGLPAMGWVSTFSFPSQLSQANTGREETFARAAFLVGSWVISPAQSLEYRIPLVLMVALILLMCYRSFDELSTYLKDGLPVLAVGLGCLVAYFFVSPIIYFPDRFPNIALPFLAAFAGARELPSRAALILTAVIGVTSAALLVQQGSMTFQAAAEVEKLLTAPTAAGKLVAVTSESPYEATDTLLYSPYYWAGAHYARRSRGVVVNAAWLSPNSPIMPFTTVRQNPWDDRNPYQMGEYILEHPERLPETTALVVSRTAPLGDRELQVAGRLGLQRRTLLTGHLAVYGK